MNADVEALRRRVEALEAQNAIRTVVARYMELCDSLGPDTPMQELGELFCLDAIWGGDGERYEGTFGVHRGRTAIVDFLGAYCTPPHFASNTHFVTTESLEVDGQHARGTWVMLQTPTFANGESFVLAARLVLEFALEDGAWRIKRFSTRNLVNRRVEGGWCSDAPLPTPALRAPGGST